MKIIPAILTGSASTAERQLSEVATDGRLELVQLDVIDGWFADNLTLTPVDYSQISFASLEAEFHLMTEEPLDYVFELLEYQHQIPVRSVIGQVERMSHQTDAALRTCIGVSPVSRRGDRAARRPREGAGADYPGRSFRRRIAHHAAPGRPACADESAARVAADRRGCVRQRGDRPQRHG